LHGTLSYAFVDGVPAAAAQPSANHSVHELQVLAVAMGVSNGGVGPGSTKGLSSVAVNGVTLFSGGDSAGDARVWRHGWSMVGEARRIFAPESTGAVPWAALSGAADDLFHVWFRSWHDLPPTAPNASQTSFALDLSTMNKGVAYVNGFNLGRYWLTPGKCNGKCAPPIKSGHCYMHWKDCDQPTQTLYHVPTSLLAPTRNLVVLFEETANSVQPRALSGVRLRALHDHPEFD